MHTLFKQCIYTLYITLTQTATRPLIVLGLFAMDLAALITDILSKFPGHCVKPCVNFTVK